MHDAPLEVCIGMGLGAKGTTGLLASSDVAVGRLARSIGGRRHGSKVLTERVAHVRSIERILHKVERPRRQRTRKLRRVHFIGSHFAAARGASSSRPFGRHHLARDAAAMGGLADGGEDWTNSVDNLGVGIRISKVHGRLNHIVGEGVTKHSLQLVPSEHLIDHHTANLVIRSAKTLLDDIGAELLLRQGRNVATEGLAERLGENGLSKVQDVLHNVVAKRILNQREGIGGDLTDQTGSLLAGRVVDAALQDTAAVAVSPNDDTVRTNGIVDELGVPGIETVEAFLDDMVTIQVLHQLDHVVLQSAHDGAGLLRSRDELNHLLQSASAVLVESNLDKLRRRVVHENGSLVVVGILQQLLAQVVTEGVCRS